MLRVLHVISSVAPRYGGAARVVQDQCRSLSSRGHVVELFTTTQDGPSTIDARVEIPFEHDGYATTYFDIIRVPLFRVSPRLRNALARRATEFDVIHVHGLYVYAVLVACAVARDRRVPYVVQPHGTLGRRIRRQHRLRKAIYTAMFERKNLDAAAAVLYASEAERQEAEETGILASGCVVPNGIDVDPYRLRMRDEDFPAAIPRDLPLLTFVGRLAPVKALDVLLAAFSRVIGSGYRVRLVLAGPDSDGLRGRLEHLARGLGVSDYVTFPGLIEGTSKIALLQQSEMFVMPSYQESFGIAVVEALAAGVPVVVSSGVGIHSYIEAAHVGIVAQPTPESLAKAMIGLLENESDRRSMASAAPAYAASRFSMDAMAESLEKAYERAIWESRR